MIRVMIVDDDDLVRAGIRAILETAPTITVAAEARDGAEAISQGQQSRPDVVLMDLDMPGYDGLTATRRLLAQPAPPRILILTNFGMDEGITTALQAGACGYLLKQLSPQQLIHAISTVAAGGTVLSPPITERLLSRATPAPASRTARSLPLLPTLSTREKQVLSYLGQGMTNADIAKALHVSTSTAKTYVSRTLTKLKLDNRIQAALLAHDLKHLTREP